MSNNIGGSGGPWRFPQNTSQKARGADNSSNTAIGLQSGGVRQLSSSQLPRLPSVRDLLGLPSNAPLSHYDQALTQQANQPVANRQARKGGSVRLDSYAICQQANEKRQSAVEQGPSDAAADGSDGENPLEFFATVALQTALGDARTGVDRQASADADRLDAPHPTSDLPNDSDAAELRDRDSSQIVNNQFADVTRSVSDEQKASSHVDPHRSSGDHGTLSSRYAFDFKFAPSMGEVANKGEGDTTDNIPPSYGDARGPGVTSSTGNNPNNPMSASGRSSGSVPKPMGTRREDATSNINNRTPGYASTSAHPKPASLKVTQVNFVETVATHTKNYLVTHWQTKKVYDVNSAPGFSDLGVDVKVEVKKIIANINTDTELANLKPPRAVSDVDKSALRYVLGLRKFSQVQIARAAGVSEATVNRTKYEIAPEETKLKRKREEADG